eukprot:gene3930-biopygen23326
MGELGKTRRHRRRVRRPSPQRDDVRHIRKHLHVLDLHRTVGPWAGWRPRAGMGTAAAARPTLALHHRPSNGGGERCNSMDQGGTARGVSGTRPGRVRFFKFYRVGRVRDASGTRPQPFLPEVAALHRSFGKRLPQLGELPIDE